MSRGYLVVYEHRTEGYSGYAPDLPGCISSGTTLEEMRQSMRDTVGAHLIALSERKEIAPQPTTTIVHFPHPSEGHGIDHWVVEAIGVPVNHPNQVQRERNARA
jgi:predicted RNase H-like HicB family nuclease